MTQPVVRHWKENICLDWGPWRGCRFWSKAGQGEVWNLIAFEMHGKLQGLAQFSWHWDRPGDHVEEKRPWQHKGGWIWTYFQSKFSVSSHPAKGFCTLQFSPGRWAEELLLIMLPIASKEMHTMRYLPWGQGHQKLHIAITTAYVLHFIAANSRMCQWYLQPSFVVLEALDKHQELDPWAVQIGSVLPPKSVELFSVKILEKSLTYLLPRAVLGEHHTIFNDFLLPPP